MYLVEAPVEDPLHLFAVEHDPLDLAALVFVVEGHGFPGGCRATNTLQTPEARPHAAEEAGLTVDGDARLRSVILAGHLPDVEGLGGRVGKQAEHEDDGVGVRKAVGMDVPARRNVQSQPGGRTRGKLDTSAPAFHVQEPELFFYCSGKLSVGIDTEEKE